MQTEEDRSHLSLAVKGRKRQQGKTGGPDCKGLVRVYTEMGRIGIDELKGD